MIQGRYSSRRGTALLIALATLVLAVTATTVLARIAMLQKAGTISRFGVVVRHHELGIRANAMVVWDVPDEQVDAIVNPANEDLQHGGGAAGAISRADSS